MIRHDYNMGLTQLEA